jgi:hypothetical protein
MSKPVITKTIIQKIDKDGKIISENITTVEDKTNEEVIDSEVFGVYL